MIDTDHYLRFERVDAVEETAHGAARRRSHGERLRVDVVAPDVVRREDQPRRRVRRGADVRGLRRPARRRPSRSTVERGRRRRARSARPRSSCRWARPVPARRPPHRRQRRSIETAADADGRYWAVRDAQRRLHRPPPLPARGRDLRPGREDRPPQPPGPRLHAVEHRRPRPDATAEFTAGRGRRTTRAATARASSSTRTTSRSRSSTTRRRRAARWRARSSTTATAATYDFSAAEEYRIHFARRPVHRVRLRRPGDAGHPRAPTPWLTGRAALPPLWALGYHQCRWFRLHAGRGRGARRAPPRPSDPLRRAVARHRVHGRLPRLHLGHGGVPRRRPACSPGWPSRASGSSRSSTRA